MIWTLLCVFVAPIGAYYLLKLLWRQYILWNAKDSKSEFANLPIPPGDFGLPIIGETVLWAVQGSRFNSIRRIKYGKLFSTNFIGKTMVKVTGPEYVKQILTARDDTVTTIWPTTVRLVLGECAIANSMGNLHKYRRRIFMKAFTKDALTSYMPRVHDSVRNKMSSWCDVTRKPYVYHEMKQLTFDNAFQVLVGLTFKDSDERQRLFGTFDTMITNLFSLPYDLPGSGFRKAMSAKGLIHSILDEHVKQKREIVKENIENEELHSGIEKHANNALHFILDAEMRDRLSGKKVVEETNINTSTDINIEDVGEEEDHVLTDEELKETTVEMLFAGYQTTASVGTSAIINLIKYPEVFHKLEKELVQFGLLSKANISSVEDGQNISNGPGTLIDNTIPDLSSLRKRASALDSMNNNPDGVNSKHREIFEENGKVAEKDITITMELLSEMPYLDQVWRETLRIMPPILGGYRLAKKTFQMGNYRIPKGWTIIYNIRDTHESEWSEDMEFRPERFSNDNWKDDKESRYRWIPFGGGRRMCVGRQFATLQFKIFIIELIRHFKKIEFSNGKPPKMFAIPFLHPTDGLPVKLTPRKPENC